MFRKIIISLVLCSALVLVIATIVSAQSGSQVLYQDAMATPTAVVPLQGDLPLANSQTGNCPMMSGSGMSGMSMNGMSGMPMDQMSGMQGQGMSGMTGMQGMSGMMGMQGQGMSGTNMTGMNAGMSYYAAPWYNNPWLMLGWILLVIAVIVIVIGVVFGFRRIRNSRAAQTVNAS